MKFITTEEIKSENKVAFHLYAADFLFIASWLLFSYIFSVFVHSRLHILYYLFSFIIAIILTMPSRINPKRRMYHSILIYIKRSNIVYHTVKNISKEQETRRLYETIRKENK